MRTSSRSPFPLSRRRLRHVLEQGEFFHQGLSDVARRFFGESITEWISTLRDALPQYGFLNFFLRNRSSGILERVLDRLFNWRKAGDFGPSAAAEPAIGVFGKKTGA